MIEIGIIVAVGIVAFFVGRYSKTLRVKELSDTFFPSKGRSEVQIANDAVMQLKNEIANSGAVIHEEMEDGNVRVKIKVLI